MADVLRPLPDIVGGIHTDIAPLAMEQPPGPALKPVALIDVHDVRTEAGNLLGEGCVQSFDDGHHHPYREYADGYPQGREQGPELMRPEGRPGDAQDLDHRCPAWSLVVSTSEAIMPSRI